MYDLESLTEAAGTTIRDVRYYIQRGVLPPPLNSSNGSYYTEDHLERLRLVVELAGKGVPLSRIKYCLDQVEQGQDAAGLLPKLDLPPRLRQERLLLSNEISLHYPPDFFNEAELLDIAGFFQQLLTAKAGGGNG
ncbi:MerR family transcriptional regulator [Victivallis sp. Marseille-Q1083]|uniref:MerR family transcriptional regulator n=1 Tax=Victivallis sp. Marseille-Q1083 TaxID=2717288 RepID=UPI0015894459|nr:MerR family transcriptional regulator [Victivallis sp. Marseille-Q1083]